MKPLDLFMVVGFAVVLIAASLRPSTDSQVVPGAPVHVEVLGDPGLRDLGLTLVADPSVWKPLPGIGTLTEIGIDTVEIWLTSDLAAGVPEGLRHPEAWVAGTADPAGARIALRTGPGLSGPGGLRAVLRHEIAHIALGAATGGNYPRWLTEGYAQYASGEWGWEDAWHLQSAFLRRGATTLEEIDLRFRNHSTEARMGYLLSRAGVFWLAVSGLVLYVALRRARDDRTRLEELRAAELRVLEESEGPSSHREMAAAAPTLSGPEKGPINLDEGPGARLT